MVPKGRTFEEYWDRKNAEGECRFQMELLPRHFPGEAGKHHTTPQVRAEKG